MAHYQYLEELLYIIASPVPAVFTLPVVAIPVLTVRARRIYTLLYGVKLLPLPLSVQYV